MNNRFLAVSLVLAASATDPTPPTVPTEPQSQFAAMAATIAPGDYTVLYLPDTQYYSASFPATFMVQVQWIASVKDSLNIVFVSHLGDVVDHDDVPGEWAVASAAMAVLDSIVPLGIAPGNHDITGPWGGTAGSWSKYRSYFPANRYSGKPYWGGYYNLNMGSRASSYQKIVAGSDSLLFLHLEFQAPDDVLAWARGVVDAHPNHRAFVSTHSYMNGAGVRTVSTKYTRTDGNNGEQIWQELVRRSPNIRLVHGGHYCGEARTVSVNDAGLGVDEILTDYQCNPNGGDGWLRYYVFKPGLGEIHAYTYSPTLDAFGTSFVLPYTLGTQSVPPPPPPPPSGVQAIPTVTCGPQVGTKSTCTFDATASTGPITGYLWIKGAPCCTVVGPTFTQTVSSPRSRIWHLVVSGAAGERDSVSFTWVVPDSGLVLP